MQPKPKFEIGQFVKYLPELFDKKTKLKVTSRMFKTTDSLCDALGVEFEPTWVYSFENQHLTAIEKDLK